MPSHFYSRLVMPFCAHPSPKLQIGILMLAYFIHTLKGPNNKAYNIKWR